MTTWLFSRAEYHGMICVWSLAFPPLLLSLHQWLCAKTKTEEEKKELLLTELQAAAELEQAI